MRICSIFHCLLTWSHIFFHPLGLCIKCFTCSSASNIDCAENFDPENTQVSPVECEVFEGRYCIKTTGVYQGQIGTSRFCSSRHLGNYCEHIKRTGDTKEYRSCVFTCSSDGCNSSLVQAAPSMYSLSTLLISLLLTTLLFS